ncbi:hypothetical protein HKX48_004357 [Thoreauomyces humboldtii]|nr:hypothetical protein HKX48_004357 [Thoreauomyces humboldtii]
MTKLQGRVDIYGNGKVAYCEQSPWIQTATVEENIVFGGASDAGRLRHVLRVCSLEDDMRQLSAGLATGLGEKGTNLSGGQRARLALARAIYVEDTEIFLLDDPISALDAHVGHEIFQRCIKDELAGKTRVLVTHHLHLMPEVDRIIVLQAGRVVEEENVDIEETEKSSVPTATDDDSSDPSGALIAEEGRAVALVFCLCAYNALSVMTSYWLVWWVDNKFESWSTKDYQIAYVCFGGGAAVFILLVNAAIMIGNYAVARDIHRSALSNLLRAPLSFFDTQPVGRMLNRFSKDIELIDFRLWNEVNITTFCIASILSSLVLMCIVQPYTLCLFVPVIVIYWFILRYYRATFRELKRLDSLLRSPLYSHISETLTGLPSIRAYRAENKFIERQRTLMDKSTAPYYLQLAAATWISVRLEISTSVLILLLAALGTAGVIGTSLLGLAFSYAIPLTSNINLVLNSFANLESDMNSIERLVEYAQDLPIEPAALLPADPTPEAWPTSGEISIQCLEPRYPSRPDHPVLQSLSLNFKAGGKIGIIGRTGSGKSTLLTALFRLVELSRGSIFIDGVDVSALGLQTLRRGIQIIPQEPVLFQGTIRSNLDLEGRCTDDENTNQIVKDLATVRLNGLSAEIIIKYLDQSLVRTIYVRDFVTTHALATSVRFDQFLISLNDQEITNWMSVNMNLQLDIPRHATRFLNEVMLDMQNAGMRIGYTFNASRKAFGLMDYTLRR